MECSQCGICCRLFLINLTQEEYKFAKYKTQFDEHETEFEEAELCGANIIAQNTDGSCIYLKDRTCVIHDIRPMSCRNFFCTSKHPGFITMIKKIQEHKHHQC